MKIIETMTARARLRIFGMAHEKKTGLGMARRIRLVCTYIPLALLFTLSAGLRADPLDNWNIRNPFLNANFGGVAYGNGHFVASSAVAVYDSTDLTSWGVANANVDDGWISAISFANGHFYASVNYDRMAISGDGTNWTDLGVVAGYNVSKVAYGNNIYVAAAGLDYLNNNLITSPDGINWTPAATGVAEYMFGLAYGNGRFVTVGSSGAIATSDNGTSWTSRTSGTSQGLTSVAFGGGQFVAVGYYGVILSSPDGVTWTTRGPGTWPDLYAITYTNGMFVAVGWTIVTSPDGVTWTERSAPTGGNMLSDVSFGNGAFVTVGSGSTILTSPNGITWTGVPTSVSSQRLTSVCYGTSNYVAVGFGGTALTSSEGIAWTLRNSGTALNLYSVAYGNGTFAAVGQIILSSPDGINWTTRDSGVNYDFEAVAYVNGGFMSVGGNGAMKASTDGITWTPRSSGTTATLYGLAYAQGLYVVVGAGGVLRTSPDGVNWTTRSSGTSQDLNGVTYGGGLFVVQGNAGVILTSNDGTNWTSRTSGTTQGLATSAYGFGYFVTVGLNGVILTSTNGSDWVTKYPGTPTLIGIVAGPTNFLTVGDSGWILESDPFPPLGIARQPRGQIVALGGAVQFSVEPWGAPPIRFQWLKDTGMLTGATNAILTLANVQSADAAGYSVIVSNVSGVLTSSVAVLTPVPILISPQPLSQTVQVGATVSFTSGAIATPPFTYQWRKEGYPVTGATNSNYSITNAQLSDAGAYTLAASNPYGSATSSVAQLTVTTLSPVTTVLFLKDYTYPTSPSEQALLNLGLSYQSFSDDTSFSNAVRNANGPTSLAVIDAVNYTHNFTALVSFLSRGGRVSFDYWNLGAGSLATALQVTVASTVFCPPPLYDWGGSPFFGGLNSPMSLQCLGYINGQTLQPAGNAYAVAGFVSNPSANQAAVVIGNTNRSIVTGFSADDITSPADAARFAQNELQFLLAPPPLQPVITFQPQDQAVTVGQNVSFGVLANGSGNLSFQWFFNQTNLLVGATGGSYSLASAQLTNAGTYSVRVTNSFGAVTSRLATLTMPVAPAITAQPQSKTVACGSNATFTVTSTGTPPLTYQWRKNGVALSGATVNTYSATPLTCQAADSYTVVITNVAGAITSSVALLAFTDSLPPTIICPANLLLGTAPGQCSATATYSVTATDNCGVVSLVLTPPSGSVFPKGTNLVTCLATDCAGNSNTCAFTVTVLDGESPILTCPTNQVAYSVSSNGAPVLFSATALDNCDGTVPVVCTPASGSVFPLGVTTVHCSAGDSSGNTNTCSFTITMVQTNTGVLPPTGRLYGKSYSEWSAAWWVWLFSLPATNHPLLDTGDVSAGQRGPVWFLGGTFGSSGTVVRNCTIPEGTALFFPIINNWADDSDCPNPDNFTEAQLRAIARGNQDQANGMTCTIDGVPVYGLDDATNSPYRVQSPVFDYLLPAAHNLLYDVLGATCYSNSSGAAIEVAGAVADGVFLMLPPLAVGSHTIRFTGAVGSPPSFTEDITYNITVAPNLGNAPVFAPAARFDGKSYGEWSAAWWQWCFSLPTGQHPLFDTADLSAGQSGPVWFLGGTFGSSGTRTRTGTVPDGTSLLFPIINNWADDTDCPNQDSFTEAQLRAIAKSNQDQATNMTCTIDGVAVLGLADPSNTPYRVTSPVFTYTIPGQDNLLAFFGLSCYTNAANTPILVDADAVSDGVFLLLNPLPPGPHVIHFYGELGDPPAFYDDITYNLTVTAPALNIRLQGGNALISWSRTSTGYVLEESDALQPGSWSPSPALISISGANNQAAVPVGAASRFFRLARPQ